MYCQAVISLFEQTPAINDQPTFLSSMQDIRPPYGFIADLSQIYLGCLQILMSQDNLGDNLQWNPVSAGICCRADFSRAVVNPGNSPQNDQKCLEV
jgi:hypothetical protein